MVVVAEEGEVFDIELDENILKANKKLALENRELLRKYEVNRWRAREKRRKKKQD